MHVSWERVDLIIHTFIFEDKTDSTVILYCAGSVNVLYPIGRGCCQSAMLKIQILLGSRIVFPSDHPDESYLVQS